MLRQLLRQLLAVGTRLPAYPSPSLLVVQRPRSRRTFWPSVLPRWQPSWGDRGVVPV